MKADLHLHTTASDGRLTPGEIVHLAVKTGLDVIAITDHDTIDGVVPALTAAESYPSLTVIPGVEINTDVPRGEVHVLGYFVDYTDGKLADSLRRLRDSRRARGLKMVDKLRDLGMDIKWQRILELAQGGTVCRPHVAQAMLEAGYVRSMREAFDKYISHDGPAYVEREKLLPSEAVRLVCEAQGLPALAHPADIDDLEGFVSELKEAGLVGLEAYYGGYAQDVVDRLLRIAQRYELIPTGGTDYHGFGGASEVFVGEALAPSSSVERLFALAGRHGLELIKRC